MLKQIILIAQLLLSFSVSAQKEFTSEVLNQGVCQDCENLLYGLSKATGLQALNLNNATSAEAIGQYYNAPQAITVHGVDFYAWQDTANPIDIAVEIYLADIELLPTGAPLASKSIAFTGGFGKGTLEELRRTVLFDVPVTVTEPYVIVLTNTNAESISMVNNDYSATPPDGQGEFLASLKIGAGWLRGSDVNISGVAFDADALLEPFVSYSLVTDFTITPAQDDGSHFVSLENNSSPVLLDRMYNVAVYVGSGELSHVYDLGDGTETTGLNATHTYANNGIYTITKNDTLSGWQRDLTSSSSQNWGDGMVAGQLTGLLAGNEITVQNNADPITLTTDGAFAFPQSVTVGEMYMVSILSQPSNPIQLCSITNETGTINDQDITNVLVSCEEGDDLIFRNGF